MPAYSRKDSAWSQTVMRQRGASAWSGDDALGFVRDGGAWVQFQAPAGDESLLRPTNMAATPDDLEATITWTNPTPLSAAATPTHIQWRVANTTPVWTEVEYPTTSVTVGFLTAATEYQFQARYIVRADGSITATGKITEVFFTTLALDGPGTPAADPGGTGPDTTVPWGDTGGTPGAVGSGGCWWEYIVQTATTPASGTLTWSDTAVTGDFAGDAGSLNIDLVAEGLTCGGLARYKYREVCNGVPEAYQFGMPFVMVCDWGVSCGGIDNSSWVKAPVDDAMFAMPKVCVRTGVALANIEDHIAEASYGKLSGFLGVSVSAGADLIIGGTIVGYEPLVAGAVGALALLTDVDDASFVAETMLASVPDGTVGIAAFPFARFGRNVALSAVKAGTSTWYARASWQLAAGGGTTLTGTTPLNIDEFNHVGVTFDNSTGEVILYVNGDQEATTTGESAAFSDAGIGQDIELYGNSFIRTGKVAGWDRVLTPAEMTDLTLTYDDQVAATADNVFYLKGGEDIVTTFGVEPQLWLTYSEALANSEYNDDPGYGPFYVEEWTDEYLSMEWPTLADGLAADVTYHLGPYWTDAWRAQESPASTYDDVLTAIGSVFELDASTDATAPNQALGTVTTTEPGDGYRYHTWTDGDGAFWVGSTSPLTADVLVVGGGGGGGRGGERCGGGGGGEVQVLTATSLTGDYEISVPARVLYQTDGEDVSFGSTIAIGGGAGGDNGGNGNDGGSGGGGATTTGVTGLGGAAIGTGNGNAGESPPADTASGGGGGAGAAGSSGSGGAGYEWPTGSGTYYGGGGGGALNGSGGIGGGGNGSQFTFSDAQDGTANTGGGGGGNYGSETGGRGGQGVVIVRYAI